MNCYLVLYLAVLMIYSHESWKAHTECCHGCKKRAIVMCQAGGFSLCLGTAALCDDFHDNSTNHVPDMPVKEWSLKAK